MHGRGCSPTQAPKKQNAKREGAGQAEPGKPKTKIPTRNHKHLKLKHQTKPK